MIALVGASAIYLIALQASIAAPTQTFRACLKDASGKATYKILVHVAPDTVHFTMDGNLVTAVPKSKFPTDGIAGIRVNHNLHLDVTPLKVSK